MSRAIGAAIAAAAAAAAVVAGAAWVSRDYAAWLALGPGGLPLTPRGWLQMTRLRLQARRPFDVGDLRQAAASDGDPGSLADLPMRAGPRPRVGVHPVPHRQLTGHAGPALQTALRAVFAAQVAADPAALAYVRSHFETHHRAVTLRPGLCRHADAWAGHGEIGHIHPSDGSMHMILSPADAVRVVERGWGERHGCAGRALGLPATYTLVYAPRDRAEVAVIGRLLDAATRHIAGWPAPAATVAPSA